MPLWESLGCLGSVGLIVFLIQVASKVQNEHPKSYSDLHSAFFNLSSGCYFNMESLNVFRESPLSRHLC